MKHKKVINSTKYRIIKNNSTYYPQIKRGCSWLDLPYSAFLDPDEIAFNVAITYESALASVKKHYTSTTGDAIFCISECPVDNKKIKIVTLKKAPNNYQLHIRISGKWKNIDNNGRVVDKHVHKSSEDAFAAYKKYLDRNFDMRIEIWGFESIKNHPYMLKYGL